MYCRASGIVPANSCVSAPVGVGYRIVAFWVGKTFLVGFESPGKGSRDSYHDRSYELRQMALEVRADVAC